MNEGFPLPKGTALGGAGGSRRLVDLLHLLQFGDSALPIGGFSFSHGLESAVENGLVTDLAGLGTFLDTALHQAATADGVALVCAMRAAEIGDLDALAAVDREVFARRLNEETRLMTVRMGRKLTELSAQVIEDGLNTEWLDRIRAGATPGTHPASLAVTAAAMAVGTGDAFALQQYGVATAILGAALRLMRVSFIDTQKLLWTAMAGVPAAFDGIADAALGDMASFAPEADILAALHVKGHVRMFMN
jgi:urease accessory protein